MARDLSAAFASAAQEEVIRPAVFYEGEFSAGTLRLWTGVGPITWDSKEWTGAGHMLGFSASQETSQVRAVNFTISLSGELSDQISLALAQCRNGLPGRVWLGLFDASGALIADPYKFFEGRLDVPEILDQAVQCTIAVRYESRLIDLEVARVRRYTPEDQAIDYPGDGGFDSVAGLQDRRVIWI